LAVVPLVVPFIKTEEKERILPLSSVTTPEILPAKEMNATSVKQRISKIRLIVLGKTNLGWEMLSKTETSPSYPSPEGEGGPANYFP